MRSSALETSLTELIEAAATLLRAELAAGAEVPFELASRRGRGGSKATLYCYEPLTGAFIAEREPPLARLPEHGAAVHVLEGFDGLDRYLASAARIDVGKVKGPGARARAAIGALLEDVFAGQSDFEPQPERVRAAIARLEQATSASLNEVTLLATLHGLTVASPELHLTKGLTIAHPEALRGVPEGAVTTADGAPGEHLLVVFGAEDTDHEDVVGRGREVLNDLLSALRLFGDGRIALGALAWTRIGAGAWRPLALGVGGRPHGMLVVSAEQEDELRAFCNLVSRRAPHGDELAWALRRFELGCARASAYEALTDHLLALRALLEPEGPASGLLARRVAALCATPADRQKLIERITKAQELERAAIAGTATERAAGQALARDVADHLRALLRDVICGHLAPDLTRLADELLAAPERLESPSPETPSPAAALPERASPEAALPEGSAEQTVGDAGEPRELVDVLV